ncbi:hypothetical protein KKH3_42740 [Pectobacterium actinidiae]|nr:hypothetical protein KKH3_42740 [Pectobacterium actinidiae]
MSHNEVLLTVTMVNGDMQQKNAHFPALYTPICHQSRCDKFSADCFFVMPLGKPFANVYFLDCEARSRLFYECCKR